MASRRRPEYDSALKETLHNSIKRELVVLPRLGLQANTGLSKTKAIWVPPGPLESPYNSYAASIGNGITCSYSLKSFPFLNQSSLRAENFRVERIMSVDIPVNGILFFLQPFLK